MRTALIATLALSSPAWADVPNVTTDIPPVQSLAAMVMAGVGEPSLILPPGATPHDFALRPSDAAKLQDADVVFWVGENLTPWLEESIEAVGQDALSQPLFETTGTLHLPFRETPVFKIDEADGDDHHDHDHGDDHADKDEHGHDDHGHDEEHAAKDEHGHDDHGHDEEHADKDEHGHDDHAGHDHGHDHDHSGDDPHAWLDPENASVWLGVMADTLADIDPDNADTYQANAKSAQAELAKLSETLRSKLDTPGEFSFVVYHDAYQYFENRFGVQTRGAIAIGDATAPGPARIEALRELVSNEDIICVFSEPQFNPTLINAVFEDADVTVSQIDPLGATLQEGATLYGELMTQMADAIAACRAS